MDDGGEPLSESARRAKFALARGTTTRMQTDLETALNDKIMAQSDSGHAITMALDLSAD